MRIGLFLGSFDPIHIGHLANIVKVIDPANGYNIDRVCVVPAYQNPWKNNHPIAFDERVLMCSKAVHELNVQLYGVNSGMIFVSDVEKRILGADHHSHIVLKKLKEEFPYDELVIVCGTDVAKSIKDWQEGMWILRNFQIITLERAGYKDELTEPGVEVSSSQIRQMIKDGQCPLPFITSDTWKEIKEHNLYKF